MPKLDFNVPVIQDGETQMKFKIDRSKMKNNGEGRAVPEPIIDADGFIVQEPVILGGDILVRIVDAFYNEHQSEKDLTVEERIKRGKFARKIADRTGASLKNYSESEIVLLFDLLVKSKAMPSIVEQVHSIIYPDSQREEQAAA